MATVLDEETGELLELDEIRVDDGDGGLRELTQEEKEERLAVDLELHERAEPDAAADDEPEAAAEPAPPPLSEKELEAALKKLDSEATRHANRVSEIMGADAQTLIPCVLCETNIPGFCFPGGVDDEKRAAVMAAIGMGEAAELVEDPETQMCEYCDGNGETITGSKVPNQATRPCPKCLANGWLSKDQVRANAVIAETQLVADQVLSDLPATPAPAYTLPQVDAWTRPIGHPNYGKNPVYMSAEERASDWEGAR